MPRHQTFSRSSGNTSIYQGGGLVLTDSDGHDSDPDDDDNPDHGHAHAYAHE